MTVPRADAFYHEITRVQWGWSDLANITHERLDFRRIVILSKSSPAIALVYPNSCLVINREILFGGIIECLGRTSGGGVA